MPGRASTDRSPDRSNRLGQPFLASRQIAARLVADAGVHADDRVVDFGAGTGVLTAALARAAVGVHEGPPLDLLGATWAPWWRFARGRRLPAASFDRRPAVDATVLEITRRPAPLVDPALLRATPPSSGRDSDPAPTPRGSGWASGSTGSARGRNRRSRLALSAVECQHELALGYPEC